MDAVYAAQRHIYDVTRKYYLLGRDRLIEELAPPPGGSVLEVGCGTARNLIAAARRWPDARFFGVDISEAMLATARAKVAKAGLSDRIMLAQGDATAFDPQTLFGVAAFDRVFASYTLSMIPDWLGAIAQAAQVLAPGGVLHIVDFGQQERMPRWWRTMLFAWLAHFHVTPRRELPVALRHVSRTNDQTFGFETLLRGYAWAGTIRA
ncbi:class I SAM-dependent methyltransferase [Sphingomonas suaedae]|uniref:Class I SAM-dependent methyltransferase n=1 Tax=Sphingomonas suaedae TaxID=2599297 RepID=A0A518RLI2_9SPHN|nr:class I SAM-dependent methyltransferase [Sphingomonas suaedae]QDX28317.1 class I SAM-dependent methyltransferase [Sphingomonas suaedae]